jgi:hypothetical protein
MKNQYISVCYAYSIVIHRQIPTGKREIGLPFFVFAMLINIL